MKFFLSFFILSIFFCCTAFAEESIVPKETSGIQTESKFNPLCISEDSQEILARRGCCSWHGGVCGCRNGRALCCDGTLSPSCGCVKEDTTRIN